MHSHHIQSIQNVREYFERDPQVLTLLLSGSIAHGFESENSDVDILIFLSEEEYQKRLQMGQVTFFNIDLCTYPGGYVDGKYLSLSFLRQVAEKGSEPARFAFEGTQILFNKIEGFEQEMRRVVAYPVAEKAERIKRFRCPTGSLELVLQRSNEERQPVPARSGGQQTDPVRRTVDPGAQ